MGDSRCTSQQRERERVAMSEVSIFSFRAQMDVFWKSTFSLRDGDDIIISSRLNRGFVSKCSLRNAYKVVIKPRRISESPEH